MASFIVPSFTYDDLDERLVELAPKVVEGRVAAVDHKVPSSSVDHPVAGRADQGMQRTYSDRDRGDRAS
jgi:hypothetical protein